MKLIFSLFRVFWFADGEQGLFLRFGEGYRGCLGLTTRATSQGSLAAPRLSRRCYQATGNG